MVSGKCGRVVGICNGKEFLCYLALNPCFNHRQTEHVKLRSVNMMNVANGVYKIVLFCLCMCGQNACVSTAFEYSVVKSTSEICNVPLTLLTVHPA